MSKYRAPKLNLDAGNELCANYQDVFQVIHGINHVKKKKKKNEEEEEEEEDEEEDEDEDDEEEKTTTATTPNSISW